MSMSPPTSPLGLLGRVGFHVVAYLAAGAVVASGLAAILTPLPVGALWPEPQPIVARTTGGAYVAHHVRTIP